MNLLVDMGNTSVKWCCGNRTSEFRTAAFSGLIDVDFFRTIWSGLDPVAAIWVSAVGSSTWLQQLQRYAQIRNIPVLQVHSTASFGLMRNAYKPPESLGADRWLAAIAAWHLFRKAVIVVDAGTAVTVDAVTAAGVFIGGVILPGRALCQQALVRGTAALELTAADVDTFPDATSAAIHRGALCAVVGGIQAAITCAESALAEPSQVVICGGDSAGLYKNMASPWQRIPDLVLQGLLRVAAP